MTDRTPPQAEAPQQAPLATQQATLASQQATPATQQAALAAQPKDNVTVQKPE